MWFVANLKAHTRVGAGRGNGGGGTVALAAAGRGAMSGLLELLMAVVTCLAAMQ